MKSNGPLSTPFDNPACPTPSASDMAGGGTKGGWSLAGAPTETPNMSELGLLPTTVDVPDGPAPGTQIAVDSAVAHPGMPIDGSISK